MIPTTKTPPKIDPSNQQQLRAQRLAKRALTAMEALRQRAARAQAKMDAALSGRIAPAQAVLDAMGAEAAKFQAYRQHLASTPPA
ncbi:MAG TPA: hypothetical protein VHY22_02840 [Chthoniobacteraceae bacterium]|jgi:hypothetical protein|nr:hypothetical protein [Chthoniobacteraceae bacterium]